MPVLGTEFDGNVELPTELNVELGRPKEGENVVVLDAVENTQEQQKGEEVKDTTR